jgi:DNA replication and repair protein RecF
VITDIRLQNFRSYTDDSFEFSPGVNIIVGPNASGKTNLLEGLLIMANGASYRAKTEELISFDQDWARLDVHGEDFERTVKILRSPLPKKEYDINGKIYNRLGINQTIPIVLFEPNHLNVLTGSPDLRRNYLDDILEQTQPGFGSLRRNYQRSLAQRNRLLKRPVIGQNELFPWDVRLAELGAEIARRRTELAQQINQKLPDLYKKISQTKQLVCVEYISSFPIDTYETSMLKRLSNDQTIDHQRGFTGSGPHREDCQLSFGKHPAVEVASRGELRTATLGLKIMELEIIESVRDQQPLLLLDDVFSELDGRRRRTLTDYLKRHQTFITTTDADIVTQNFTQRCNIIPISQS